MYDFSKLLNPSRIAIVGVSQDESKVSTTIFKQLKSSGYSGDIIPVNPKYTEVLGSQCYPDLNSIEGEVDIAVIVIPAAAVLDVFQNLAVGKLKFAVIISGGFHKDGDESMEEKLESLAKEKQVRFIGPNSLGFIYPKNNLNLSFGPLTPPNGNVSLISQSGAVLTVISDIAHDYNLGINQAYSIGDKLDINENELLELLINDPDTEVIGGYLEKIEDPNRFLELARSTDKPIIMLEPLESKAAIEFSERHTGENENDVDIKSIFNQAGIIIVESIEDLFFNMLTIQWCPKPVSKRVGIISNTGGFAAVTTDALSESGFEILEFVNETNEKIKNTFENKFEAGNPLDILGDATSNEYSKALEILREDSNTDIITIILTPQSNTDVVNIANEIVRLKGEKPIICIFIGGSHVKEGISILLQNEIPAFRFLEHGIEAIRSLGKN
jgi:acyl-CoA synthetase (NDP forming)